VPPRAPPRAGNWFSAANALRVYANYLALDADQNGMLSPSELGAYGGRLYTSAFVARLFQECHTYASSARDAATGVWAMGAPLRFATTSAIYSITGRLEASRRARRTALQNCLAPASQASSDGFARMQRFPGRRCLSGVRGGQFCGWRSRLWCNWRRG
jgi:hypothetical protein